MLHNMKHKATFAFFLLLVCTSLRSQGIPAEGRDFYLGYLTPSYNRVVPEDTKKFFGIFAFVSAYQDTKVFVSYFDSVSGKESLPTEHFVKAKQTVEIRLDTNRMRMKDPGDLFAEYRSVHITSEHPVSVMYYSQGACAGGEYLALSTASLGKNYVVGSYFDNPYGDLAMLGGRGPSQLDIACGYFLVIAVHDSTKVTMTPNSTTQGGKHPGVNTGPGSTGAPQPFVVKLQRGQCYLLKSHCGSSENDISGSIVQSDKPVAVISGHENMGYGSVGSRSLEGRDYMVEQILPAEYGANTGFVTIPLVDSDPYNADATGENYRTSTFSQDGTRIDMSIAGVSGTSSMDVGRYSARDKFEVESPIEVTSTNGTGGLGNNFNLFQIDIANHSAKPPFPRPSMMTIVPIKNWRTSYLVRVPHRDDVVLENNFINVIGAKDGALYDSISVSRNGEPYVKIRNAGFTNAGKYDNIPSYTSLRGQRYGLDSGTYHIHSPYPFMVYNYGFRGVSANGYNSFSAFASPAGHLDSIPASNSIGFLVDTSCINFNIKLWDATQSSKIKAVMLLDDPTMDMIKPPSGAPAYVSTNCSIVTGTAPYRTRELALDWSDSAVTVRITKDNPSLGAEAYIYVVSTSGTMILHLKNILSSDITGGLNPYVFKSNKYNFPIDTSTVFKNSGTSNSYVITNVTMTDADTSAIVIGTIPVLPAVLAPGDSLIVMFRIFPKELSPTMNYVNIIGDSCVMGSQGYIYSYRTGLIESSDANFGKVALGSKDCSKRVFVTNRGEMPFTLQNYTIRFPNYFSMTDESAKQLPKVLHPGDSVFFDVCYTPSGPQKDSSGVFWITDIPAPYDSVYKRISKLTGIGAATDISWNRDSIHFAVTQLQSQQTRRVYLRNNSNSYPIIPKIYIEGPDAPEFSISKTQIGGTTNLELTPFDSIYVDVTFKADLASGWKRIRHARLVAQISSDLTIHMDLYGKVDSAQTSVRELPIADFLITPNPLNGDVVSVSFTSLDQKKLSFAIYDMLGREVAVVREKVYFGGKNTLTVPIGDVAAGVYILRVTDGILTRSISFRVVR
jgi:hypothetical protein